MQRLRRNSSSCPSWTHNREPHPTRRAACSSCAAWPSLPEECASSNLSILSRRSSCTVLSSLIAPLLAHSRSTCSAVRGRRNTARIFAFFAPSPPRGMLPPPSLAGVPFVSAGVPGLSSLRRAAGLVRRTGIGASVASSFCPEGGAMVGVCNAPSKKSPEGGAMVGVRRAPCGDRWRPEGDSPSRWTALRTAGLAAPAAAAASVCSMSWTCSFLRCLEGMFLAQRQPLPDTLRR